MGRLSACSDAGLEPAHWCPVRRVQVETAGQKLAEAVLADDAPSAAVRSSSVEAVFGVKRSAAVVSSEMALWSAFDRNAVMASHKLGADDVADMADMADRLYFGMLVGICVKGCPLAAVHMVGVLVGRMATDFVVHLGLVQHSLGMRVFPEPLQLLLERLYIQGGLQIHM